MVGRTHPQPTSAWWGAHALGTLMSGGGAHTQPISAGWGARALNPMMFDGYPFGGHDNVDHTANEAHDGVGARCGGARWAGSAGA